jgi:hypothetical protein
MHSNIKKFKLSVFLPVLVLTGCAASIEPMGNIGSNKVYAISNSGFLSSSQMIVVMNKKGNVAAYSGGTTPGLGVVALQTSESVLTAGAIAYAGRSIEQGLKNTQVKMKGIPSNINVNTSSDFHVVNKGN